MFESEFVKRTRDLHQADGLNLSRERIRVAVQHEMAVRLGDFVYRRSHLAEAGRLDRGILEVCAETMSKELCWNHDRRRIELDEVNKQLLQSAQELSDPPKPVTVFPV